jgi:ABC-2 type transport system ATP-binding protein
MLCSLLPRELLILDEPTAALDVDARRTFWDRVRVYVAGGRTVLFATHRLEEADAIAGRVVVIAGGRLLADGTPDQVKAQAAGRSTISVAADGGPGISSSACPQSRPSARTEVG